MNFLVQIGLVGHPTSEGQVQAINYNYGSVVAFGLIHPCALGALFLPRTLFGEPEFREAVR